jgi:Stress responsive A/B Barrel Domain
LTDETPAQELRDSAITAPDYRPGLVKHIVLFQYRETATPAQRQEIEDRFHALRESTRGGEEYILSIESGPQNSPEGLHRGLEHGFIVTFRSQGDRNYYLGQPLITDPDCYDSAHHEFKEFVGPYLEPNGVLVFDFPVQQR